MCTCKARTCSPHMSTATALLRAPSVGVPFLPLRCPQAPRSAKHPSCLKVHISFRPHRSVPRWLSHKKVRGPLIPVPCPTSLLGPRNSLLWAPRLMKIFREDSIIRFCLLLLSLPQTETQALGVDKYLSSITQRGMDVPVQINSLRPSLPFYKLSKIYLTLNVLLHPVFHTQAPGPVNFSFINLHLDPPFPSLLPPCSFKFLSLCPRFTSKIH